MHSCILMTAHFPLPTFIRLPPMFLLFVILFQAPDYPANECTWSPTKTIRPWASSPTPTHYFSDAKQDANNFLRLFRHYLKTIIQTRIYGVPGTRDLGLIEGLSDLWGTEAVYPTRFSRNRYYLDFTRTKNFQAGSKLRK